MSEFTEDQPDPSWAPDLGPAEADGKKRNEAPLDVAPIHGVLPFAGARNPLTRSNTARRVSFAAATPATGGVPQVYHFESEAESVVAIEALLHPDLHGLEVQLPPIPFRCRRSGRTREHHFDLRLTYRDGHRRAVFVRNGWSLGKRATQDEIDDIFTAIPEGFADDAVVVNADDYSRAYRDNLRRIWHLSRNPDPAADAHVEAVARAANYWLMKDLVAQCDLPPAAAWQSAMRLIGRRILRADWHAAITLHSRIGLAA
ncbi:hypothetical protein EBL87_17940 [Cereibacter sphaeroides]|uniref:hypothetical protein n=1 Tax=Cereibacter sphaeroides TaxID=1063 RepID=UPI000F523C48|nr:hypothetical protein [Cereibacter sphaeroides]AZB65613.1 hypothetical protein EBL87_17940 [Cereibacter sphaeroides]AZB70368.1 hypothetical protein EBL86_18495 [Cereibacter sphaeroides]